MVDNVMATAYVEKYEALLLRAVAAFEGLMALYAPDAQAGNAYAVSCANEAANKRQVTLDYLVPSGHELSVEITSTYNALVLHYLDAHWADYALYPPGNVEGLGYPVYDLMKHDKISHLHTELNTVMSGIGEITNALSRRE